ncbi:unnamed protein product [Miscanthus lutarioriparius]|uniref:Pectinesterase inhibitor domain-containing protein n=1 Tax=Miscanthus lutarioriparius TaxID=422564 RepID=A0A811QGD3_9POAL|nr:unnamed protein product [Miscanthus lutarioriparius]
MASSSTHSFLLLFPLLLLLSTVVDSGSAPTPAPAATAEKYQKWCQVASDSQSCIKVIESIPGIQEVDYNNAGKVADLCMHFAANKTTEAKGAADTLLAAAKGKPSSCLKACATNIKSMAEVLVNLPAGQDDMNAYLTFKDVRAKFKDEKPPACEKDCWNKTSSSSADETGIVDKFHDIWNVAKVGNMQINYIFPWPDSDDDDNIL